MRTGKLIEWTVNENGCHICTSHSKDKDGYTKLKRDNRSWQMHRYVYTQEHGEIPKGLVVMHSCDNPSCINIEHLSLGTIGDNHQDMMDKGRWKRWNTKSVKNTTEILPKLIKELRTERKISGTFISEEIGIDSSYFYKIEKHKVNGSVEVLSAIAQVLNVPFTDLFKK